MEDSQFLIRLGELALKAGILRCLLLLTLGVGALLTLFTASGVELRILQAELPGGFGHTNSLS